MKRVLALLAAAAAVVGSVADTPIVVSTKLGAVRGAVSPYGYQVSAHCKCTALRLQHHAESFEGV